MKMNKPKPNQSLDNMGGEENTFLEGDLETKEDGTYFTNFRNRLSQQVIK